MRRRKKAKEREKDLAKQRIVRLLRLADEVYPSEPELGLRYGELARRLALRTKVRIPEEWKWRYCKGCGSFLYPGINADVRTRDRRLPHLVIRCRLCGEMRRIPYLREKRARRSASR